MLPKRLVKKQTAQPVRNGIDIFWVNQQSSLSGHLSERALIGGQYGRSRNHGFCDRQPESFHQRRKYKRQRMPYEAVDNNSRLMGKAKYIGISVNILVMITDKY
ncbi:hypothetical protein AX777_23375 [Sphingobium yanoikuyae]|uniref:Uncharacterized protein n=1 Tax=Sphingobium yanoikuyae TaxID=13690 RepID=A0A177JD35_SPHYA|nr:hypothetical protein AX777_23375 [Sphingobium yanoikuyae]